MHAAKSRVRPLCQLPRRCRRSGPVPPIQLQIGRIFADLGSDYTVHGYGSIHSSAGGVYRSNHFEYSGRAETVAIMYTPQ